MDQHDQWRFADEREKLMRIQRQDALSPLQSMNDLPEGERRRYDAYANERDQHELERLMIEQQRIEEIRDGDNILASQAAQDGLDDIDKAIQFTFGDRADQDELIVADMRQQELDEDDQKWDEAWDQWLDELEAGEQMEREQRENDEGIQDR